MVPVKIRGLIQVSEPGSPSIVLTSSDDVLLISIGIAEATSIQLALEKHKLPRPLAHDLIVNILSGLNTVLRSVTVYKIEDATFYAYLRLEQFNDQEEVIQELRIDARPSDAIALSVRTQCPIYVAEEVMKEAGLKAELFYRELGLDQETVDEIEEYYRQELGGDDEDDEDDDEEDDDFPPPF